MPHCLRSMASTLTRQAVGINHCIIVHWPTGREGLWGSDCFVHSPQGDCVLPAASFHDF
jgi:hypothetical protein